MQLPSLPALAALEGVAEHGSVTAAARALHLTQSALSHRLRSLERETGLRLIEHVGRGVRLTPAALRLARAAAEARRLLEDTIASLAREPARAVLSISCSPSFAIRFLVPRLARFRAAHPDLELRIAADDFALEPLHAGADACVRLAAGPAARAYSEKLADEQVFPVVSPRLLEAGPPLRKPADLTRHTLLHDEALAHEPKRVGWSAWLAATGGADGANTAGVRFSHAYLAIEAALAGDGVALVRRTLVADDLERGRLVAPLRESVASGLAYWLFTAHDPATKPALAVLRRFLRENLQEAHATADRARGQRRRRSKRPGGAGRRRER